MSKEDKFYTSEDLTGYDLNDRLYSESEVNNMNDMFSEFFSENSEYYNGDVDEAYSDFFDAYSASGSNIVNNTPANHIPKERAPKGAKKVGRALAAATGATVGLGVGALLARKDKAKRALLVSRVSSGTASKQDLKELSNLNAKIKAKTIGGAALGAGAGYGTARVLSKLNTK